MEHITDGKIKIKCSNCGTEFVKWKCEITLTNFCKQSCYFSYIKSGKHSTIGQSAEKHPNWQGGRTYINADGYRMVWAFNYPGSHQNVIAEHILVIEKKLGRLLKLGEEVHHINHIRTDNRPENLVIFSSHSEHLRNAKHIRKIPQPKDPITGRFI